MPIHFTMLINLLVPDVLLTKLLQQSSIKTRSGVLLVTLLYPHWLRFFLSGGAQALGDPFSSIDVGNVKLPT